MESRGWRRLWFPSSVWQVDGDRVASIPCFTLNIWLPDQLVDLNLPICHLQGDRTAGDRAGRDDGSRRNRWPEARILTHPGPATRRPGRLIRPGPGKVGRVGLSRRRAYRGPRG